MVFLTRKNMVKVRPYAPPDRIAIRESSIDEECSDDIEDDVFIRDGKSGKCNEERGLKRPLMAPRRKNQYTNNNNSNKKASHSVPIMKKQRRRCWKCCEPFCYGLAAISILIALIFLAALLLTLFPIPLQKIKVWLHNDRPFVSRLRSGYDALSPEMVPCTQISVQRVWSKTFARLNSESPVRNADLNGDKTDDIIFGFGVDDSIQYEDVALPKCISSIDDEEVPCEGGVIALNGLTGEILWQRWSSANVFSILCSIDIDQDGFTDCVAAGRLGLIFAINGRNGNVIWNYREIETDPSSQILTDLYTINAVHDLDDDGIPEILAAHVEEREFLRLGHIRLISGRTGKVIRTIPTPNNEEVYVPVQLVTKEDGTELLLITTGGQNTPGGIYATRLQALMQFNSEKAFEPLYQTDSSGFMVSAVLSDINGDFIEDIIISSFNSTVYAFDGRNYSQIWSYSFPASESVSYIVPGYFNHDNVTDFMVKYNTGPGYPVYYYSQTTILNGTNGQPLLDSMMTDSGGPNSILGGVSVSQTFGGDFFLHWQTQCRGKTDAKDAYQFISESDINLQARADTCLLRYNTTTVLKLYAIARHVEPPGAVIFSSDDLNLRLNRTEYPLLVQKSSVSPIKHPKMLKKLVIKDSPAASVDDTVVVRPIKTIFTHNGDKKRKEMQSDDTLSMHVGAEAYRKPIFRTKPLMETNDNDGIAIQNPYERAKSYMYLPFQNQASERQFKYPKEFDPEQPSLNNLPQRTQEEYETLYNDDGQQQNNVRPINLRRKYPGRDVRSDFVDYDIPVSSDNEENRTAATPHAKLPNSKKSKEQQLVNLWDLEIEKENQEVLNEQKKYDDSERKKRQILEDSAENGKTAADDDDSFLASVSSAGALLPSIDVTAQSSIDFAFVLNVRESEVYPPLLLPDDLSCIEEQIQRYKGYSPEDILEFEKQALKKCLRSRNVSFEDRVPRYESQIVITRISISCTCNSLQDGEVCSKIESFEKQRWRQFMGNTGNGIYPNY